MGTLAPWKYPDCKRIDGGEMSGDGPPQLRAVRCKAVMTTPDPFEKVVGFYAQKIEANEPAAPPAPKAEPRSVGIQDDSGERPVSVRIFNVYKADSTTVLVISRAENEKQTHIAWSHCRRLGEIE
jgi:hypothetical protein